MPSAARIVPILACLAISSAGIAASLGAGKPSTDSSVVAVFPPWWSASRTLVAASRAGAVLNSGVYSFVVVVQSQDSEQDRELGARLRAAGALLLLDPLGLGGCLQSPARNQNV
jgi:hypothetical protein